MSDPTAPGAAHVTRALSGTEGYPDLFGAFRDCDCGHTFHDGHHAGTFATEDEARRAAGLERAHCSIPGNHPPHGLGAQRCTGYRYPDDED
jgi:hypothetical protein